MLHNKWIATLIWPILTSSSGTTHCWKVSNLPFILPFSAMVCRQLTSSHILMILIFHVSTHNQFTISSDWYKWSWLFSSTQWTLSWWFKSHNMSWTRMHSCSIWMSSVMHTWTHRWIVYVQCQTSTTCLKDYISSCCRICRSSNWRQYCKICWTLWGSLIKLEISFIIMMGIWTVSLHLNDLIVLRKILRWKDLTPWSSYLSSIRCFLRM